MLNEVNIIKHEYYIIEIVNVKYYYVVMENNLKNFGKFIKIERIKNDFSQEQLAEKAGVSARTISLIESGLQHPKFFLVVKLSQVLDFDLNALKY